jgi:two-component system CheB/CheR fusion protein
VDRRYDVHVINGAARRLLGIHSSAMGEDFVHLAQAVPSAELRELIDRVFRGEADAASGEASGGGLGAGEGVGVQVMKAQPPVGEVRHLQVAAHPYRQEEHGEPLAVVLAWDVTQLEEQRLRLANERTRLDGELGQQGQQLERLRDGNRRLLEANRELTETNAALRSANEELLVSHEEAQAATEEVETLNEELQATNEEQETLNEELQATVEELNTTNDDLQARSTELQELAAALEDEREQLRAVLASMGEPVLVLDNAGAPLLTNEAYERLFGVGGPTEVLAAAREAAGRGGEEGRAAPFELRFSHTGTDGRRLTYEARGRPVVGERGRQGSVITFSKVGEGE